VNFATAGDANRTWAASSVDLETSSLLHSHSVGRIAESDAGVFRRLMKLTQNVRPRLLDLSSAFTVLLPDRGHERLDEFVIEICEVDS
jgi:hypothetical protein